MPRLLEYKNMDNTITFNYDNILDFIKDSACLGEELYNNIDKELPKKLITETMKDDHISGFLNSLATGTIDLKSLIEKPESFVIIEKTNKLNKAEQIRLKQREEKFKYRYLEYIKLLDLIDKTIKSSTITPELLKKFLNNVDNFIKECSSIANDLSLCRKISIFIILRSLVDRYKTDSIDKQLIELILEFYFLCNDFKFDWINVAEDNLKETKGRKKLGHILNEIYTLPSVDELTSNNISSKLAKTIKYYIKLTEEIFKKQDINPIEFQMKYLYHKIPPFSLWTVNEYKLDDWQHEVINHINNNNSVVISAPTSSGKTVCALYCAIKNDNKCVIYVVPCDELAIQVAALFCKNGISVSFCTNRGEYNNIDATKVIVATPNKAEEIYLSFISQKKKIDYMVFDEIQQINEKEGVNLELLVKMCECPFLILSATLHNPDKFIRYLENIKMKKIYLVKYNKRFIVQQKYIYNGFELKRLHPFAAIDIDYILNDKFTTGDLSMTPNDIYHLGIAMKEEFPEYTLFDPNDYFINNPRLTNDLCQEFEEYLNSHISHFENFGQMQLYFATNTLIK